MTQPSTRYTPLAKALHWLVAALIIVQYTTAFLLPHIGRKTAPSDIISLHFSVGVLIMIVMIVRLGRRVLHPVALEVGDAAPWERLLAKATHWLIYVILIISPMLGWASASAHSLAVSLFGLPLPTLAAPGTRWANQAGDIHGTAMWVLLWLIGLHILATLYHHLLRRDGTLLRMMPAHRAKL
ncbi:cytochrome b [Massilia norwichensis]|uniref:Cytochrome b n=1 Tax=Massilia norwichensis TaxID=1442366 RepID=A0ABT2AC88_9BURK|nr:cytochrome b [Massilia norwichensis]MCS0591826.1 cytochrome b [Massilia norwichensis]